MGCCCGGCWSWGRSSAFAEGLCNLGRFPLGIPDLLLDSGEVDGGLLAVKSAEDLKEVGCGEELACGVPRERDGVCMQFGEE